jgi:anti-sigma factor RsiW
MTGPTGLPGPGHGEALEELAVGFALHALEPEDADLFTAHLEGCARCRQIVEETTDVMAAMAAAAPSAEPPHGLRERLRAEVARTEQEFSAARGSTSPPHAGGGPTVAQLPVPRRRRTSVLVAAAVAAVVALGGWAAVLVGERDEARKTAAADASMVEELLRPGRATVVPVADDEGRTVATLLARDDAVQVVSHGLAPNDTDAQTYVLWGLDDGAPEAVGTFDVSGSDRELHTLDASAGGDFSGYGISIEPGRQAPEAPTDVVASGSLPS